MPDPDDGGRQPAPVDAVPAAPDDYAAPDSVESKEPPTEPEAAEPDAATGPVPAGQPSSQPTAASQRGDATVAALADDPSPPSALQPLAPGDDGPGDASLRIMCPREQRCLWAGFELPDPTEHPDPATEVREAAGCLADPPTCACTREEQDHNKALVDAVSVMAGEVTLPTAVGVLRERLASDGPAGAPVAAPQNSATLSAVATPQVLTSAQAHGLDRAERPMREAIALGTMEVSEVLGRLGLGTPPVLAPEADAQHPDGDTPSNPDA